MTPFARAEKEADREFGAMIKARDGYACVFHQLFKEAGIRAPCRCSGPKIWFHVLSRRYKVIRYHGSNSFCACRSANWWEKNNRDTWVRDYAPRLIKGFPWLWETRNTVVHRKVSDLNAIRFDSRLKRAEYLKGRER